MPNPPPRVWSCLMATARNQILPLRFRAVATLVALISVIVLAVTSCQPSPAAAASCPAPALDCTTGSISGGQVVIGRTKTSPGTPAKPATRTPGGSIIVVPRPVMDPGALNLVCAITIPRPWYCPAPAAPATIPAIAARPSVTLSDIASFVPQTVSLLSEPAGWGLVGVPVNFVARASTHQVTGRLLGSTATVRFTPVSFTFAFGDGARISTTAGGTTWADSGVPAFSVTPTSHSYTRSGSFEAVVTVYYSAAYRYPGDAWTMISGRVSRQAATNIAVVTGGIPVLVAQPCAGMTAAPGC